MLDSVQLPKPKKSRSKLWFSLVLLALLALGIFVGSRLVIFAERIFEGEEVFSFKKLFLAPDNKLLDEDTGEIRILLLGIGGEKHEGGTLADTIILATLKLPNSEQKKPQVGLIAIPRDLVVNIPGLDYRKINNAYAYGEAGGKKQGPKLTLKTMEAVLGETVPYYGVIDFEGFKKIIDDLRGIEIHVEVGFTDSRFPDDRGGYLAPLTFEPGKQKMNGQRALEFVRSRHGDNKQGSDFARSRRQQLVLKAVKEKTANLKTLTNLGLIDKLLSDLSDHVRTNLNPHELKRLYSLTRDLETADIRSYTIDGESGLVCDQIVEENGAYVLVPCEGLGRYEKIRALIKNQFLITSLKEEESLIEIQNASGIPLLGQRAEIVLTLPSLKVTATNFKGQASYQQSIIYDNTGGKKPETLKYLTDKLGLKVAQSPFPFQTTGENPDFVIIVSSDLETKLP